jgi:hypothetical protein
VRFTRFATSAAVALGALVLSAGPASATTTLDPDVRSFINGVTCVGDTVSGAVRIQSTKFVPARVEVRYNAGGRAFTKVLSARDLTTGKGIQDYPFSLDISAAPADTTQFVAYATAGVAPNVDTGQSKVMLAAECAPGEEIPEVPMAALVPLTLAGTAAAVVLVSRNRRGTAAARG